MSKDLYSPLSSNIHIKDIEEYKKLYTESIENPKDFFGKLAKENIAWFEDFDEVHNDKFSNTKWFKGGKTNLSFNCIDRHLKNDANKTAIIWEGDDPSD